MFMCEILKHPKRIFTPISSRQIGSVHQSYTGDEGALILVLWSGCHANITPEKCAGLCESVAQGGCKGGSLLRPGEGWTK
jgi:hypothetical protein